MLKTIIRDLRKFLIQDFNSTTSYIKKKRYRTPQFYLECLKTYIEAKFDHAKDIENLDIYLGSIIYPKDLKTATSEETHICIANFVHDSMYKFSLEKM